MSSLEVAVGKSNKRIQGNERTPQAFDQAALAAKGRFTMPVEATPPVEEKPVKPVVPPPAQQQPRRNWLVPSLAAVGGALLVAFIGYLVLWGHAAPPTPGVNCPCQQVQVAAPAPTVIKAADKPDEEKKDKKEEKTETAAKQAAAEAEAAKATAKAASIQHCIEKVGAEFAGNPATIKYCL